MMGVALAVASAIGAANACPPAPPPGLVARSASFGGVIAPTGFDVDRAVIAGAVASGAAHRFLGLDTPPFLIAQRTSGAPTAPGGCAFVFPWVFARADSDVSAPPTHVLPHEIGHALFIRFLVPNSGVDQYGGDAPDWLDEMAALACEDDAGVRLRRLDTLRLAKRGALIPITRLLTMPHPEWHAEATNDPASASTTPRRPTSADTPAFYATVRGLFDFLIERTHDERVIRHMADNFRAGGSLAGWIIAHTRLGTASAGFGDFDRALTAFVLADPRYRSAATERSDVSTR